MLPKDTIVRMEFGSTVYGTRVPTSDLDYKGILLPSPQDILLQRAKSGISTSTGNDNSRNTKDDIDDEMYWLHNFCKLLAEGQTGALDMFFTPRNHIIYASPLWLYIQQNKEQFLSKNMKSFIGYCVGQSQKYSLKGDYMKAYKDAYEFFANANQNHRVWEVNCVLLMYSNPLIKIVELPDANGKYLEYIQVGPKTKVPFTATCKTAATIFKEQYDKYGARATMAMNNQGVDWKSLLHAVRVINQGIELCQTGHITFPRPEADLLLKIRKGELPYQEVSEIIDNGLTILKAEMETSKLPEKANIKWIDSFVVSTYANHIYQTL